MEAFLWGAGFGVVVSTVAFGLLLAWLWGQRGAASSDAQDALERASDADKAAEKRRLVEGLAELDRAAPETLKDMLNSDDGGPPVPPPGPPSVR